jgi:galactokinase
MTGLTWARPPHEETVVDALAEAFGDRFGGPPAGVWSAPGRVNLIGEHTDYNDGFCLPMALPHRTYAAARPRSDGRLQVASRQQPRGWAGPVEQVRHGEPTGWAAYVAGVASVLAGSVGADALGMDVLVDGYVPLGAGLSSSAALSCSAGIAWRDLVPALADWSAADLARACVRAENEVAGAATGGMDQTVALRAVDGHAILIDCRDFSLTPVAWGLPDHEVLVIDTRAHHSLADGQYAARRADCERACAALGIASLREVGPAGLGAALALLRDDATAVARVRHVVTENDRVHRLVAALADGEPAAVGALMTASHLSLRDDYQVSCRELDLAVDAAMAAGAAGARMTGGGFGGSAIALVARASVEQVAGAVARSFADEGLREPHFLDASPSAPAARYRAVS